MTENKIEFLYSRSTVSDIVTATAALQGLDRVLSSLGESIGEAFSVSGYQDYLKTVRRFGKSLTDELLKLQLSFGRMKQAIAQAFAPIAAVVVPWLNQAVDAVTRFAGVLGQLFAGLLGGISGNNALADSAREAAAAEETFQTAAVSAAKAARRSLMGFDELNRLNAPTGGGSSGGSITIPPVVTEISPQVQALVDQILALLQPLLAIDLAPLRSALEVLKASLQGVLQLLGQGLQWLWLEVLTPFGAWVMETMAPVLVEGLAAAFSAVAAVLEPVMAGLQRLWQALTPVVSYIGDTVMGVLEGFRTIFQDLTQALELGGTRIQVIFAGIAGAIQGAWRLIQPILLLVQAVALSVFATVGATVGAVANGILKALAGITTFLAGVFTADWAKAWEGIQMLFNGVVNSIIGLLNGMINALVEALNAVVRTVNKLSFTVPDWVPAIGGNKFGFHLKQVSAPQIPYLAQGAVLPANRPFLAMVGDQRHGTNIEAPLATIEEAVAAVLQGYMGSLAAGLEAMVAEQRQTRRSIEQIRVGDSVIGRAAQRYQARAMTLSGGV